MKKILFACLITLVFITTSQTVSADIGPKAGVTVTVEGVQGDYAFELLYYINPSRQTSINTNIERFLEARDDEDYTNLYYRDHYPDAFVYYSDDENYFPFSVHIMYGPGWMRQTDEHTYHMGYNAPRELKFAIYTEDDVLIVSEAVERVAFDAHYTWDLSDVDLSQQQSDAGVISSDETIALSVLEFFIRVIFTVLIELGILALFKYKKKNSFKLVGIVNIITQSLLSIFVVVTFYRFGSLSAILTLILGEAIVFFSESLFYVLFLREKSKVRAFIYALVANTATMIFSIVIWFIVLFITL